MTDISSLLILALLVLAQNRKQPVLATKVEANHETKNCTLQQSLWIKMDGLSNTGTTERVSESKIPVYPLEQGAFASYNKVRLPKTYKLTVSCNGNKSTSKINFLTAIQKMETGKNSDQSPVTVKIVTPESTSPAVCLIHTDQRREARSGATLLIFQLTFQEVISIPSPTTPTAEPSGTATQSFGQLSPTTTPTGNFGSINPNARGATGLNPAIQ